MQFFTTEYRPAQIKAPAPGGRWTCAHFVGEKLARGAHVVCRREGQRQVQANPSGGCAFWMRAMGVD